MLAVSTSADAEAGLYWRSIPNQSVGEATTSKPEKQRAGDFVIDLLSGVITTTTTVRRNKRHHIGQAEQAVRNVTNFSAKRAK